MNVYDPLLEYWQDFKGSCMAVEVRLESSGDKEDILTALKVLESSYRVFVRRARDLARELDDGA